MIYTFEEQFKMILYFIILGIFLSIMFDTINTIFNKVKVINYICQFIVWTIVNIIAVNYIDKISDGYVPIYIILFFVIGYMIYYYLMRKYYLKTILNISRYQRGIMLALFPINLYNCIIKKLKHIVMKRKKKHEKNSDIININGNDNDNTRVHE